ncbi:hypothetical protein VB618_16835 [Microvirga sp. CF3062]|uniref:hypothetical protein n=1 Tax=Microvirga sp. CF3062 TaxID=3110182 RepID=UPI002E79BD0C|nr:hypothetical protein [Microvirga sp. CF3062]MEE1657868.1 hypothetical protein [Microvirga sp. CF3062]
MTDKPAPLTPRDLFQEQQATREDVLRLHPLLSLLEEEPTEGSPLDEIKALLTSTLDVLRHQSEILARLDTAFARGSLPPPSAASTSAI